jgi:hypothetical protein
MVDHAFREQITLLLVNDALEANKRNRAEATLQLLDAAGTLIVDAFRHNGADARELADMFAQYLVQQVTHYTDGGQ